MIFASFVAAGLALAVSAQKPDDKKDKPPKNPPTVDPGNKTKPPPKEDKRPKKPGMAFVLIVERRESDAA